MSGDGRATGHAGLEPARPGILPAGLTHLLYIEAIFRVRNKMSSVQGPVGELLGCSFPALMVQHGPLSSLLLLGSPFAQEIAPFI